MGVGAYLKLSIVVALATMALKAFAWWLTGAVSLLSDALEALVNLAGATFALAMVTIAARPPDEGHPYGHHKAEYFSSAFEGMLIFAAALAIVSAAAHRLLAPQPLESLGIGLALTALSAVLNGALARAMLRQSKVHRSVALEADARHLFTDVWTSAGVIVGLFAAHLTGWLWLDPVIAIGVALNILREGATLVWRSASGLMDEALEPEVRAMIDATLDRFRDDAIRFDHIVSRRAGRRCFVALHMHMPANWTLRRAASVRADVEASLMRAVPGLRATIEMLPTDVEAHFNDMQEVQ